MEKTLLAYIIGASFLGFSGGAIAYTENVDGITVNNEIVSIPENTAGQGNQSVSNGGIINNNIVRDNGTIFIRYEGRANDTTVDQNGRLSVENSVINNTQVNAGGSLDMYFDSRSIGYLNIAQGGKLSISNTDHTAIDVTTNNPAKAANITIENLNVAGTVSIGPTWLNGELEDFASMPSTKGTSLITQINNLVLQDGYVDLIAYSPAAQPNRLEINNLSGQGNFAITTQLADKMGDFIHIANKATGQFGLMVNDSGKEPQTTAPLTVVHVNSGDANFSLLNANNVVDLGVYQYKLYSAKSGESTDWYLNPVPVKLEDLQESGDANSAGNGNGNGSGSGSGSGTVNRTLSSSAKGVLNMAAAPRHILSAELSTLRQRQGDLSLDKAGNAGVWARYTNDTSRLSDNKHTSFKNTLNGLEIGGDKQIDLNQSKLLVGVFTSYSNSDVKFDNGGNGEIRSYGGGAYLTYLDISGFYIDSVLKGNHLSNEIRTQMSSGNTGTGSYSQNAITASLESGFNIPLYQTYAVEPYAKVQYSNIGSANYTLSNGMSAHIDNADSVQGELGTLFSTQFSSGQMVVKPYAKLAVAREFIKSNKVDINDIGFNNNFSGNVGKYGLGLDAAITNHASVYAEVDYQNGNKVETPVRVDAGFRIRF
ncbi:autotransporter outer membrane beta-barrel domain-containing protein [Pragia fontium]|uniref:autotransporter outer membrane beta-barrel domain-containing protein n=1 Tax=Pragia fontium TaxID=82985 RepID=UPI0006499A93|nr:autotransporter outer membrane beta-barrel domain-containing protein [Pragia fontium]AKJ43447.1 autotransporter [Pragia fontium]